jgi:hypothetical protein
MSLALSGGPLSGGQRSHRAWAETIHAEWTKLRTLASTGWLLAGAVVLTVTVGTTALAATTCPPGACAASQTGLDPAKLSGQGRPGRRPYAGGGRRRRPGVRAGIGTWSRSAR